MLDENVIARLSALAVVGHVGVAQRSGDWRSSPRGPVPVDVAVTAAVSSSPAGNGPGPAGQGGAQAVPPKIPKMRASVATMTTTGFGYGSRLVYLDRAIYTTITLMSVLVVYDGWQNLKLRDAVGVILGPVLAIFVSHVFSASLARQAELQKRPGRSETMRIIRTEARFLLLAAPALALVIILTVAGISLSQSIQIIIFLEGLSLGFWGFVAGRRAGLAGWPLALTVVMGLIMGLLVLALQVFLQPGNASLVE